MLSQTTHLWENEFYPLLAYGITIIKNPMKEKMVAFFTVN